MISIKNQVPGIYYDASRDFQILGHFLWVVRPWIGGDVLLILYIGIMYK
jgi:hypothetical protein